MENGHAEYSVLGREHRGKVLAMGGLALRMVELSAQVISTRDVHAAAEIFDLRESVEELGRQARELADRILTESLCDRCRQKKLLSSLSIGHLLTRISSRAVEIGGSAQDVTERAESEAARLLNPLFAGVYQLMCKVVTAYADRDAEGAEEVVRSAALHSHTADDVEVQLGLPGSRGR